MTKNDSQYDKKFELMDNSTAETLVSSIRNSLYGGAASIAANLTLVQEAGVTERVIVSTAIGVGIFKLLDKS
jgi:hypothetical protein